jgi:hypothetical protein
MQNDHRTLKPEEQHPDPEKPEEAGVRENKEKIIK